MEINGIYVIVGFICFAFGGFIGVFIIVTFLNPANYLKKFQRKKEQEEQLKTQTGFNTQSRRSVPKL